MNKPNLLLSKHSLAIHKIYIMNCKYRKGALGALPDPELINSLLSIKGDVRGDDADAK